MKIYCIRTEHLCVQQGIGIYYCRDYLNNVLSVGVAHQVRYTALRISFKKKQEVVSKYQKKSISSFFVSEGEFMNQAVIYLRTNISIVLILVFVLGIVTTACAEGKDLSRAKAQSLITQSADFKQPAVLSLISPIENDPFELDKASDSEKVEEAKARDLQRFLSYYPQIAFASHLGLATIEQQFLRERKAVGFQVPAQWFFKDTARATEQGKAMWKEYGFQPAPDDSIPLARKEFVNITGITSLGQNGAQADFTWKWNANKVGLALQENTDEFKALPEQIRKGLLGQAPGNRMSLVENWSGERKGRAAFQRYDDGWRLVGIMNY